MRESGCPIPVAAVVATVSEIFRHQGRTEVANLLEVAHAHFDESDYDNWNGGTYTWALVLEVPVSLFAIIEPSLEPLEKEIGSKLAYLNRQFSNDNFCEVAITPITSGASVLGTPIQPAEPDVGRIWADGRFRAFLSHVSVHKVAVSALKDALALRGIAAFVAHEDIAPSLEWQREIEIALRSMHALVALITPDFHPSAWTDQEVGWALGRGLLVVPVRLGANPYGFVGKYQGIAGTLDQPDTLANSITRALLANTQTHGEMRRSLVRAFSEADSTKMATTLCPLVLGVIDFTDDEKSMLQKACAENANVAAAPKAVDSIYGAFGTPTEPEPAGISDDEVPF